MFLLVKGGQDNRLPAHHQIFDPIKKSLEALDSTIPISVSFLSIGDLGLVSIPLPDIVKLPMYD